MSEKFSSTNESLSEKSIEMEEKFKAAVEEAVEVAIINGRDQASVNDGKSFIVIKIKENDLKAESYSILMGHNVIATAQRRYGVLDFKYLRTAKDIQRKLHDRFNLARIRATQTIAVKQAVQESIDDKNPDKNILKQAEALGIETTGYTKQALEENSDATLMGMGREFDASDSFHKWLRETMKIDTNEVWRVRTEDDSHGYKYIYKDKSTGKYVEMPLKEIHGSNPTKEIYTINSDGEVIQKEVDHIAILPGGNYGIATDKPDNEMSDYTRSYAITFEGGKWYGKPLLEQKGYNRDANYRGKEVYDRADGTREKEDLIKQEKDAGLDGKTTPEEIGLHKSLQNLGLSGDEITEIFRKIDSKEVKMEDVQVAADKNDTRRLKGLGSREEEQYLPGQGIRRR